MGGVCRYASSGHYNILSTNYYYGSEVGRDSFGEMAYWFSSVSIFVFIGVVSSHILFSLCSIHHALVICRSGFSYKNTREIKAINIFFLL